MFEFHPDHGSYVAKALAQPILSFPDIGAFPGEATTLQMRLNSQRAYKKMVCTHVSYESNLEISTATRVFSNIRKFNFLIDCNEFIKLSFFRNISTKYRLYEIDCRSPEV